MRFIIFIRQKIDWEKISEDEFKSQDEKSTIYKLNNSSIDLLKTWEDMFSCKFTEFRREMKNIAYKQNCKCNIEILQGKEEIEKEMEREEDAYILPTDDDDFFHPDIFSKLNQIKSENGIILWPEGWVMGSKAFKTRPPSRGTGTNTYAIKKSTLRTVNKDLQWRLVRHHGSVQRVLYSDLSIKDFIDTCEFIDEPLSVSNRHVGTITLWQNTINKPQEVHQKILKRYFEYTSFDLEIHEHYSWTKEAVLQNMEEHNKIFSTKCLRFLNPPANWKNKFPLY